MFSRLQVAAARAVASPAAAAALRLRAAPMSAAVRVLSTSAPVHSEERDLVNFPRRSMEAYPGECRLGFIPIGFFEQFYPKTGATGGYVCLGTILTFLYSKEILIMDHEFYTGVCMYMLVYTVIKLYGPAAVAFSDKEMALREAELKAIRQDEIDRCKNAIAEEEKAQWMATSYEQLILAKKENVALQLENAYRARLQEAHQKVKTRLDYQLETAKVLRDMEHKHMVDWIISNVRKSVTGAEEDAALRQSIRDLKGMAPTA